MQLPKETGSYLPLVRAGLYISRRVRRDGRDSLATDIHTASITVRNAGRAWEDAGDSVQLGLADRDACDDTLDFVAQETRLSLAATSISAFKEAPYTLIFPEGIGYYTAALVDQEVTRYTELRDRLVSHLDTSNSVRVVNVPRIETGLAEYVSAVTALENAERVQLLARTQLVHTMRSFIRQLEKTYGLLVSEVGKAKAERYFPKVKSKKAEETGEG